MVSFRKATLKDKELLLKFEQGVVDAERPFSPPMVNGRIQYYDLDVLIKDNDSDIIIGELNDQTACCAYIKIKKTQSFIKRELYGYIGFMYVDKNFRGQGLSQSILNYLKTWAKEHGLEEIRLEVYNENKKAKSAYEKYGFKPLLLEMRMEI